MDILKRDNQNYNIWLMWQPHFKCNLDCSYCSVKDSRNIVKISEINIPALLKTLNDTKKIINLEIGGGEPFLIPNLIKACKEIAKNHFISLATNLTSNRVKKFSEEISPERVEYIYTSVHIKELERLSLIDKYVNNFHICKERNFNIGAFVVAYPSLLNEVVEYKKFFQKKGITLYFKPYHGEYRGKFYPNSYSEKELKIFNFHKKLISGKQAKYIICNAGYNVGTVNPYNKVRSCYLVPKKIGNLYSAIKFTKKLIRCPFDLCPCPIYIKDTHLFKKAVEETNFRIVSSLLMRMYVLRKYSINKLMRFLKSSKINYAISKNRKIRRLMYIISTLL